MFGKFSFLLDGQIVLKLHTKLIDDNGYTLYSLGIRDYQNVDQSLHRKSTEFVDLKLMECKIQFKGGDRKSVV